MSTTTFLLFALIWIPVLSIAAGLIVSEATK